MPATFQEAIPFILIAIVVLIALWLLLRSSRRATVVDKTDGDVLDEGASPAARNQALIDSPRSVEIIQGQTSANANTQKVATADVNADAEAGAQVAPTIPDTTPDPARGIDDLKRIKGLGPKLVGILHEQGVTRFEQIAAWTDDDIARIDGTLGRFAGRINRDKWVEQAKLLARGDEAGFEDQFGRNG